MRGRAAPGQENGTGCPRGPKVSQCALPTTAIRRRNGAVLHPRSALKSRQLSESPGAWETPCETVLCAVPLFAVRPSGHQRLQWDPCRGRDTARHPATTRHTDRSLEPQSCPVRTSRTCYCAHGGPLAKLATFSTWLLSDTADAHTSLAPLPPTRVLGVLWPPRPTPARCRLSQPPHLPLDKASMDVTQHGQSEETLGSGTSRAGLSPGASTARALG